ncbi:hypothetical protein [Pedobacter aquatilis]|uniref:hypothetical protein n=1 Tax=Pedobacter aquatilis TaxID=351343 RepID=UPI00292E5284|nr:hypothetical protein [Pedobacter aquatilis]
MSAIDKYNHRHLGFIECPSTFNFIYNNDTRKVAIYELQEDMTADELDFDGKIGDIILGGGSGEAPAFRISIPEAIKFFREDEWNDFEDYTDLYKAFWTPTQSYNYCEGFSKTGWTPESTIEFWLAKNICSLLIDNFENYSAYSTPLLSKSTLKFIKSH